MTDYVEEDSADDEIYSKTLDELLSLGYAFVVWTPEEMEGVDEEQRSSIIDTMNSMASEFFDACRSANDMLPDDEDEDEDG